MRKPLRLAVKGGPIIGAADKQCNNTAASKLNTWSAISDELASVDQIENVSEHPALGIA